MSPQELEASDTTTKVYYHNSATRRKILSIMYGLLALYAVTLLLSPAAGWLSWVGSIAMFLGAVVVVYAINTQRLIVSQHIIEYHAGYFSLTTTWNNVERIETPKPYLRLRERPATRGILGQIVMSLKPMRIPLFSYWRESGLGQDIMQYAPRLWLTNMPI